MNASQHAEMMSRADQMLESYANAPRRYVLGRRDAALAQASNPMLSGPQVAYWNRIADGCAAIAKATGSAA